MLVSDDKVAILGFGVEGQTLLKYLLDNEFYKITICDRSEDVMNDPQWKKLGIDSINWSVGENYLDGLKDQDVIFRSPGFHILMPALLEAQRQGTKVTSSTILFMKNARGKIIGVTGTKGKGTTSTLIYKILREAGIDAYLGGNIGISPLSFIDELTDDSVTVLEMSSFQLQDLDVSPDIAVVLKTTVEHLDYHEHMEEYWEAKAMITRHQTPEDYIVVNQDYDYARYFLGLTQAQPLLVSTKKPIAEVPQEYPGRDDRVPLGAFMQKDALVLKMPSDDLLAVCKQSDVALIGPHNLENVLPALCVGGIMNIDPGIMKAAVAKFTGLPHRLEVVGDVDGVKYVNDSFSSIPETCIAAINSFAQPIILMVGGSEKHSDFRELAKKIVKSKNVKSVIFMGDQAAERIYQGIEKLNEKLTNKAVAMESQGKVLENRDIPLKMIKAANFGEAFLAARLEADEGDVVLMSPACASFNWFKNYKERGNMFREMVNQL